MLALFAASTRAACPAVHQAAATYCNTMLSTASASSTAHHTRTLSRRAGSQCLVPQHAAGSPAITLSQRRLWHSAITHARRARSQLAQDGRRRRPPPPQPQRVGSGASNPLIPNDNPAVRPRRSNLSAAAGDAGPMASHDRNSPGRRIRPSDSAHAVPSPTRTPSRARCTLPNPHSFLPPPLLPQSHSEHVRVAQRAAALQRLHHVPHGHRPPSLRHHRQQGVRAPPAAHGRKR